MYKIMRYGYGEKNETTHSLTTWNCLSPMRRTCGQTIRSGDLQALARAIEALSIVAVHLGIKQKSLFDHLIEDVQTLNAIAKEIEAEEFRSLSRIQKTFVISRRTLVCLDEISRQFRAPRDALVEYSIQRLLPVIHREREKHRRRKKRLPKSISISRRA